MGVVNLTFYLLSTRLEQNRLEEFAWRIREAEEAYQSYLMLNLSKEEFLATLENLQLRYIPKLTTPSQLPAEPPHFQLGRVLIAGRYGLYFSQFSSVGVEDLKSYPSFWPFYLAIDLVLIGYFSWLYRKLLPLREIARQIRLLPRPEQIQISPTFQELEEIVEKLNSQARELEGLNSSRRFLLRTLFHELLTPIAKIKLTLPLLSSEKERERISRNLKRLEEVIEELKAVEFLLAQKSSFNFQPMEIEKVVRRGLQLALEELPVEGRGGRIVGDLNYISIGVKNLVDNAKKYGKKGKVKIGANWIEVWSEGPPLPKPLEEYLHPFNHAYEGEKGGLGLGLYIVSQVAEAHHAQFYYRREGEWNIFGLKFPSPDPGQ
ncbi:MAG: ATP-binding protein [Campylobacterales bacterium]